MKNWKTNLGAAGVALGTIATVITSVSNGTFVLNAETIGAIIAAGSAVWGLFQAKDWNVSGGQVKQ